MSLDLLPSSPSPSEYHLHSQPTSASRFCLTAGVASSPCPFTISMAPRLSVPSVLLTLNIRDSDPDHTFQGYDADNIANALVAHSQKMAEIAAETSASSSSYQGHDSSDISKAIQSYVITHQDSPWLHKFTQPSELATAHAQPLVELSHNTLAVTSSSSTGVTGDVSLSPVFSLSTLVHEQYWMSVLLCIVWIITGLILLFFGWASFFWGSNLGNSPKRLDEKIRKASRLCPLFAGPPLAGGVGGVVVGFLFLSFLTTVVTASICVAENKSVSSIAYFVIWLLPGLLGAFLAGHWPFFARACTGLLCGACFTLIITAMFGIHTLIIRAIIIIVFTCLVTAPLLIPKRNVIRFHLLNICTSIIGMVTFLDGVALFAPPRASSDSWIDLWVLLFALDNSTSELSATRKWGSGAFKGLIAASVLGTLIGFAFEFIFHKHAAEDPDMEWNNYLGSFTQHLQDSPEDRAGSFEPEATIWQKLARAFTPASRPAAYGNVSATAKDDLEKSPLTELPIAKSRRKARRARSARKGPAKFSALDRVESDSETDYDSDFSIGKLNPRPISTKTFESKLDADELADQLKPLAASNDSKSTSVPGLLARPPSYRTNSSKSGSGSTGSGISGTTANSADIAVTSCLSSKSGDGAVGLMISPPRPGFERATTMSPPPPFPSSGAPSPLAPSFPATPSLVNAITRIQAAQAQARAWYQSNQQQNTSADSKSTSVEPKQESSTSKDASQTQSKSTDGSTKRTSSPSAPALATEANATFQDWWGKEVKGEPKS